MEVQEHEHYIAIRFAHRDVGGRTLCVIDDQWRYVVGLRAAWNDCVELTTAKSEYSRLFEPTRGSDAEAIAILPFFCPSLPNIEELIVGDFPRAARTGATCLDYALTLVRRNRDVVFLIDLWDGDEDNTAGERVLDRIISAGIAQWRCAFLTVGGMTNVKLLKIKKDDVCESKGSCISEWWNDLLGRICYDYFQSETSKREHADWHEPSKILRHLNELNAEGEPFNDFIDVLSLRTKQYGVWSWVKGQLTEPSLPDKQKCFAYLCGKVFLWCGQKEKFRFCGLRALAFGLGETYDIEVTVDPEYLPSNVNNTKHGGTLEFGNGVIFEDFANALTSWIEFVHDGYVDKTIHRSRLSKVSLTEDNKFWVLRCHFSDSLPLAKWAEGGATGRNWRHFIA